MPPKLIKNEQEIAARVIQSLERNTDLSDLSPGSIARALVDIVSAEMGDLYSSLDFNFTQGMLDKARGSALDALGGLLDVSRTQGFATTFDASSCSFYFYINTDPNHTPGEPNATVGSVIAGPEPAITIPVGTRVSTSGDYVGRRLSFSTTEEVIMSTDQSMIYVGLTPGSVDMLLNTGKGTLRVHSYQGCSALYCYNPKAINAVLGFETDDDYRWRIRGELRKLAKGNRWALYMAALGTNGIRSANVYEFSKGLGSVEVIVSPTKVGENRASVLMNATSNVNEARSAGVNVIVSYPTFIPIDVSGRLGFNNSISSAKATSLRSQAQKAIVNYIDNLGVGETLVYNKILGIVLSLSPSIVDFQVSSIAANGQMLALRNYPTQHNEQLYANTISII